VEKEIDFESHANDFILDGFDINLQAGIVGGALNSKHPYENGGTDNWVDYTAAYRFPIKIHELYHYIKFDEVAMIEAGEDDSDFTSDDFYDYVVVEGSNDDGETWIPFEEGWDCRFHQEWIDYYNAALTEKEYFASSSLISDKNLYRKHEIDLTAPAEFSVGDIIRIRFRLNSDPFATGWGWIVDNLKIQTVGLQNSVVSKNEIKVYPNPVQNNEFSIEGLNVSIDRLKLYDYTGRLVYLQKDINPGIKISLPYSLKGLHILYIEGTNFIYKTKLNFN
jgi:hypothetical protein